MSGSAGDVFKRRFLSGALVALLFSGAKPFMQLKKGIMGNIHVKLYEIWTSGSGDVVYRRFLSRALAAPLFSGLESFVQFWKTAS